MIIITNSQAGLNDKEYDNILKILDIVDKQDYIITIIPTSLNKVYSYSIAITILRQYEGEIKKLSNEIKNLLKIHGYDSTIEKTKIYVSNNAIRFYFENIVQKSRR